MWFVYIIISFFLVHLIVRKFIVHIPRHVIKEVVLLGEDFWHIRKPWFLIAVGTFDNGNDASDYGNLYNFYFRVMESIKYQMEYSTIQNKLTIIEMNTQTRASEGVRISLLSKFAFHIIFLAWSYAWLVTDRCICQYDSVKMIPYYVWSCSLLTKEQATPTLSGSAIILLPVNFLTVFRIV